VRVCVQVRLARYDVTLFSLINHNLGKEYFSQHLKAEYSFENMLVCVCMCVMCSLCVVCGVCVVCVCVCVFGIWGSASKTYQC